MNKEAKAHQVQKAKGQDRTAWYLTPEQEMMVQMAKDSMTVEDLREEDRAKYIKVRDEGLGVSASSRWSSGCLRCSEPKENTMKMRDEILQEDGGLEVVHIIDPFVER